MSVDNTEASFRILQIVALMTPVGLIALQAYFTVILRGDRNHPPYGGMAITISLYALSLSGISTVIYLLAQELGTLQKLSLIGILLALVLLVLSTQLTAYEKRFIYRREESLVNLIKNIIVWRQSREDNPEHVQTQLKDYD